MDILSSNVSVVFSYRYEPFWSIEVKLYGGASSSESTSVVDIPMSSELATEPPLMLEPPMILDEEF